eukprot:262246-Pelagomonas_calceolata.AAC.1
MRGMAEGGAIVAYREGVCMCPEDLVTVADHFYTTATSSNGMLSIPLTNPNTPNIPIAQIGSHNPRKKRKRLLYIEPENFRPLPSTL